MKEPHTALFVAATGVGKTHLALSLLETEYRNHFDFIVIIRPTLRYKGLAKLANIACQTLLFVCVSLAMDNQRTLLFG